MDELSEGGVIPCYVEIGIEGMVWGWGDDKGARTLLAPYRVMRVTLPASLSRLTAKESDQIIRSVSKVDDLHKKRRNGRDRPTKEKKRLAIQQPHQLFPLHTRAHFDTNRGS